MHHRSLVIAPWLFPFQSLIKLFLVIGKSQMGVVRSNCMDCLDRTNSAQSWIGQKMLDKQLQSLVVDIKDNAARRLHDMYQQMWINNGNSLSNLYAGTGALSQGGSKILDGARSAARTIQNNLLDKDKQEAFDVFVHGGVKITDFKDRARLVLPKTMYHAPTPFQHSLCEKWPEYSKHEPLRVGIGTYNINGGKHFRSVVYKDVSLDNWLIPNHTELISIDETKPIDIYAIGFEEMVDLDAKNIMNTCGDNAKQWCQELTSTLNNNNKIDCQYSLVTYTQLVGVCLYVYVKSDLAPLIR